MAMKLYSFWRSLATFRVRIALNVKGIAPEVLYVDLMKGVQRSPEYREINPQMLIPTLIDGDGPPIQESLAIIEYLDEIMPTPPLLPPDPRGKARVRGLAMMVACEAHPLIVPRVREFLEHEFGLPEAARLKWLRHWTNEGLQALEAHLSRSTATGRFCHGDAPTMADLCLVSHAAAAEYFQCEVAPFPTVARIVDACLAIEAFARAHPLAQPDAPKQGTH
jgi:maleylacetoacetate isomerase